MKLFCFLGNIGKKYEKTRHNAGFLLGDFLRKKISGSEWRNEKKFFGEISIVETRCIVSLENNEKIIFLKPSTFMNLSGKSLLAVMQFYKISPKDICIFYDDKDLAFEKIRYRKKGSAGGHNGIKDIIRTLGTQEFDRIKIGVDNEKRQGELRSKRGCPGVEIFKNTADFVLANFSGDELITLESEVFPEVEEKIFEEIL